MAAPRHITILYGIVLAATQNPLAARLAAEVALIALQPPIQILQEAIQIIAAQVVAAMFGDIDAIVRETSHSSLALVDVLLSIL